MPLTIAFGSRTYRDGIDLTPTEFLGLLQSAPELPRTSQPPIPAFEAAFRAAVDEGRDVVCITISSRLSGTHNSARLAAESVDPDRIDGRRFAIDDDAGRMGRGPRRAPCPAGRAGAEVAEAARAAVSHVKLYAVLRTLDYVHKGGRIGKAQQLVGSALAIKPILSIVDGELIPVERVRLWKKAVARVTELITPTPTDIIVLHSENLEDARQVAEHFGSLYPQAQLDIGYAGAVITTYAGPGAIGVAALYPVE